MARAKPKAGSEEKGETVHRTVHARLPLELLPACHSIARHVRDVKNSATWLARTTLNCFERAPESKAWTLKSEELRPTGCKEALAAFDGAIEQINASRKAAAKEDDKPKLLTKLGGGLNAQPLSTILDQTLFHKACRDRVDGLDPEKKTAASRIPSHIAKAAREEVLASFSGWLAALSSWSSNPSLFTGMPRMPGFVPAGKLPAFTFPLTETTRRFPGLDKFAMKLDEDKASDLSSADKAEWNTFALRELVDRSIQAWSKAMKHPEGAAKAKAVRVRIGRTKIELDIMAELPRTFPEGSFLAELKAREPEAWQARAGKPATLEAWIREIVRNQVWLGGDAPFAVAARRAAPKPPSTLASARYDWISEKFEIVGGDPGESNLISLAFSSGAPMMVFCGQAYSRKMARFDDKIDGLASRLCPEELKALQAKRQALRDQNLELSQAELSRLRSLASALWSSPEILKFREKKSNFSKAEAHRLASRCAKAAGEARAAVFVLSRNHGLKSASGRSSKQERKSHNIPHALFASLLREKLERLGIAMIETEESFTSQASFVDGDPLGVHAKGKRQEAAKAKRAAKAAKSPGPQAKAEALAPQEPSEHHETEAKEQKEQTKAKPSTPPSGARRSSDRHWLDRGLPLKPASAPRANPHRRRRVHADGQAALNAIRKVCPGFACTLKTNLAHELWRLHFGRWRPLGPTL